MGFRYAIHIPKGFWHPPAYRIFIRRCLVCDCLKKLVALVMGHGVIVQYFRKTA